MALKKSAIKPKLVDDDEVIEKVKETVADADVVQGKKDSELGPFFKAEELSNNINKEEEMQKVEEVIQDAVEENMSNSNYDSFVKEEQIENSNIYASLSLNEILKASARKANIPEVECSYKINHVTLEKNVLTKNGIKDRIPVDYYLTYKCNGEYKEAMLTQKYNVSNHPQSNLQKFLMKIKDAKLEGINSLNDLIGISGTARITHKTMEDGSVFENIQILTASRN